MKALDIEEQSSMHAEVEKNYKKYFLCFFLMGLINNSGYVMIITAA